MNEIVYKFKMDAEELYKDMYNQLNTLIDDALFNMSFTNGNVEEHYAMLIETLIEVIHEQMISIYVKGESN